MKNLISALFWTALLSVLSFAQTSFVVTGTAIPADLLQQNYGKLPKGLIAYDLNVCNVSPTRQAVVSSQIYQAMSRADVNLQPIGRQIMLATILRNQNRSAAGVWMVALNSAATVLSILSSSRYSVPRGLATAAAVGAISAQQITAALKQSSSNQLEKFETQVLESALVLDGGSCVERSVFAATANPKSKSQSLSFYVR